MKTDKTPSSESQKCPPEIEGFCGSCGNYRTHSRTAWTSAGWVYECPSCGTCNTRGKIDYETRRRN